MADGLAGRKGAMWTAATSSGTLTLFGKIRNWQISANSETIDVSNNDSSSWEEGIDGLRAWTFRCEAIAVSTGVTAQHDELRGFLSSGARRWYKVGQTTGSDYNWRGYGYVTDWDLGGDVRDAQLTNFTIKGDGAYVESST